MNIKYPLINPGIKEVQMVINIRDAQEKFQSLIDEVVKFENDTEAIGITIKKSHNFELSEEWNMYYRDTEVGWFMWNVPHMISLKLNGKLIIDSDYINGLHEWKSYLAKAREEIESYIECMGNKDG